MLTCPYCQHDAVKQKIGAFLQIGSFYKGEYAIEGGAETYTCLRCNKDFWANGPVVDIVYAAVVDGKVLAVFHTSEESQHYLGNVLYVAGEATDKPEEEYAKRADEVRKYGSANFNGSYYLSQARNRMDT